MEPLKQFFLSKQYAVVGASTDTSKYGYKVLRWYLDHSMPVTPINPRVDYIDSVPTIKSLADLADPMHTSVSIITPPKVTMRILEEALRVGVPWVWMQPGAFDQESLDFVEKTGIKYIAHNRCILIEGEKGLDMTGKL